MITVLLGILLARGFCEETTTPITLSTPRGDLQGFHVDYGNDKTQLYYGNGDVFLGIPYAEPPVGELRFQKTKPICQYPGSSPYNATSYRPACPQQGGCNNAEMSEDCLYLNVYSPNVKSVYKYPVLLWIHGGSMKSGCTQQYPHKGAIRNLVSRGVVVVVFQYRLGFAGFFTTFTDDFPPNRGMLDQVEAIRWVSDNIQYFGGNPYRVTLFGESAGGASVSAHTYSPLSQNLFQQAIMESGVVLTSFEGALGFTNLSETRAFQLCNFTDVMWKAGDFTALKGCLSEVTPDDWTKEESTNILGWQIAQDDYFMPDVPRKLAPLRPQIPVMLGSNRDEWSFFWEYMILNGIEFDFFNKGFFEGVFQDVAGFLANREMDVLGILEQVYLPPNSDPNDPLTWFRTGSDIFTAAGFTGFILKEVDHWLSSGNDQVYLWEQTYASNVGKIIDLPVNTTWKPVCHVAEVYFIWMQEKEWLKALGKNETDFDSQLPFLGRIKLSFDRIRSIDYEITFPVVPFDYQLADWYGETWTNFAKYGVPKVDGSWKPVPARRNNQYMKIDQPSEDGFTMQNGYRYTDEVTWLRVIPSLAGVWPPEKPDYNNGTTTPVPKFLFVCPNDRPQPGGGCNPNIPTQTPFPTTVFTATVSTIPTTSVTIATPTTPQVEVTTTDGKDGSKSSRSPTTIIVILIFTSLFML